MMKFLVYLENEFNIKNKSTWRFITATSKKEAIMKFVNHTSINDKYFLKQIYGYYLTSDICENFFDTIAPENSSNAYLNNLWKENVIKFFRDNTEWANLFIKSAFYKEKIKFPNEMIFYIANNCWYSVIAIDVDDPKFNMQL